MSGITAEPRNVYYHHPDRPPLRVIGWTFTTGRATPVVLVGVRGVPLDPDAPGFLRWEDDNL